MQHTDLIQKQFDKQAKIYSEMDVTRDTKGHDAIVAICGTDSNHKVLDVACGPGLLSQRFARVAAEVIGIDITTNLLAIANESAAEAKVENLRFMSGDVNALPFDDNSFDIVCCRAAFHHFPDPASVLAEMARVVKVGGTIAIADITTSEDAAKAEYQNKLEILCDPSHTRVIPLSEFKTMIAASGLSLSKTFPGSEDYDLEKWILHGGPDEVGTQQIRDLMRAAIDTDLSDLNVRVEAGRIRFRHQTIMLLAVKEA